MKKLIGKFLFTLLMAQGSLSHASENSRCFKTSEEFNEAHSRLKAQLICSSSESMKECQSLLFVNKAVVNPEGAPVLECRSGDIKLASTLPLAGSAAGVLFLKKISQNMKKDHLGRVYVNSVVDFHHHTKMHKQRVTKLAIELMKKFPKQFKGLSEEMVIRILSKHDNAKIDPKFRYSKGGPFYEALYSHYGKKPPMDVINQLNNIDGKIMEQALKDEGLGFDFNDSKKERMRKISLRQKILSLEKTADFVDRAMNPVSSEEFGRKMWKESSVAKTEMAKKMALYLENNYSKMVSHLNYKKLSVKEYYALAEKIKIDKYFHALLTSGRTMKEISARSMSGILHAINSRKGRDIAKVGGRVLLGASLALDGLLLAGYSTSVGCSSMPGFHEWVVKDGKCQPVLGLNEKFIKYLSLPEEEKVSELNWGQRMCEVVKGNDSVNKENIFTKISCAPGSARMELEEGKYLDISYNYTGEVSKINLKRMSSYIPGVIGTSLDEVNYDKEGRISQICSNNKRQFKICRKPNTSSTLSLTKNVTNYLNSMNYKIQQGIGCCLGIRNQFNKNITCSI